MNLNELAREIHAGNHQWWHDAEGTPIARNGDELLMLVITELAEAVEGIRKNLMDDKLPQFKMEVVEMADAKIRLLDFAGGFRIPLSEGRHFEFRDNKAQSILRICNVVCGASFDPSGCISDSITMIDDYCTRYYLPLDQAMTAKRAYNKTREDHTHEARALAGGKKF